MGEYPEYDNLNKDGKPRKEWLKQYYWKPGQSGNPKGRPKGKTLKDYVRDYLACMTEEERQDFLDGMPKEIIWKMAEGNPQNDLTSNGETVIIPIYGGLSTSNSDKKDIQPNKEN